MIKREWLEMNNLKQVQVDHLMEALVVLVGFQDLKGFKINLSRLKEDKEEHKEEIHLEIYLKNSRNSLEDRIKVVKEEVSNSHK